MSRDYERKAETKMLKETIINGVCVHTFYDLFLRLARYKEAILSQMGVDVLVGNDIAIIAGAKRIEELENEVKKLRKRLDGIYARGCITELLDYERYIKEKRSW